MRDPRPGFAKSFRNSYAGLVRERLLGEVIALMSFCACAGPGVSVAPAAPPTISPAATAAAATERPRAIALSYVAPAGCPDVDGYWHHVHARSTIARVESSGETTSDALDVRVQLSPTGSGWTGRLTIAGVQELDREVRGERCEDVVEALALITVLRLEGVDANRSREARPAPAATGATSGSSAARVGGSTAAPSSDQTRQSPETSANDVRPPSASAESGTPAPASESAPGAPSSAPASPPESASRAPAAPASAAPAPKAPVPAVPPLAPPSVSEPSASERQAADAARDAENAEAERADEPGEAAPEEGLAPNQRGAGAPERQRAVEDTSLVDAGNATSPSEPEQSRRVRVGVAAQAGYATVPARALRGLLEGELRFGEKMSSWGTTLSLAYTRSASQAEEAELDITLFTAELALCPPSFVDAASVWIRVCAGLRGGGVQVIITPSDPSLSSADVWRPWLAVDPSLQLGVPLSQGWALRGVLGLAVQLVRDRFYVDDLRVAEQPERIRLYRPRAVSFEFGLGLGYTF